MVDIMKEATAKANAEHKEFEAALKKRRREFGEQLEKYAAEVEVRVLLVLLCRPVSAATARAFTATRGVALIPCQHSAQQRWQRGVASRTVGSRGARSACGEAWLSLDNMQQCF